MAKNLVIVESPAKAKTIERYLGRDFTVTASKGHVKDLPTNQLGVDIHKEFAPQYVTVRGKGTILKEICRLSKGVERVFLAPDPDREGEAIAFHIADEIRSGVRGDRGPQLKRVLITEITKRGIAEAFATPQDLHLDRYNSQQARRVLDRLVGYQLSPLLWDKVRRGLSAGRVQSVAVRLVVDREREIEAFVPQEFWRIEALLEGQKGPAFWARLVKQGGKDLTVPDGETSARHVKALQAARYHIARIEKKERRRNPQAPFITSRLQQEAARKLRMSGKKAMMVAQKLYEGVALGAEGLVGLITYMRTDSTRVSDDALKEVRDYIKDTYGAQQLPASPRQFAKSKKAQDAHEAIRPTSVLRTPQAMRPYLQKDELRLYELIWQRFVASQMAAAVYDATTVDVEATAPASAFEPGQSTAPYVLRATGSVLRFAGFLDLYQEGRDDEVEVGEDGEQDTKLPHLEENEALRKHELRAEQCFTKPPPRFTEASLVRELEEKAIGRPSTYAAIISTIQDKGYVERDRGRFKPTELGRVVTDLLVESFPDVLNVEFTAEMEDELDKVEEGKLGWTQVLHNFYGPFSKDLDKARKTMRDLKREVEPTDITCEVCGSPMVIRWGKNGSFLACSAYPDCKNTREFKRENGRIQIVEPEVVQSGTCPTCKAPMVIKTGKFGRFRACSRYPDCKTTAPVSTGVTCPDCGKGDVVEKRSKRGKTFFGCNRFPECKYASWDELVPVKCRQCNNPYLLRKVQKSGDEDLVCPSCHSRQRVSQEGEGATPGF